MSKSRLKANFHGLAENSKGCALIIDPANPDHWGEKLAALLVAAIKNRTKIVLFLDDVNCSNDPQSSVACANQWLAVHRPMLDKAKVTFDTDTRFSTLARSPVFQRTVQCLEDMHKRNMPIRKLLTDMAVKDIDIKTAGLEEMRGALKKTFSRIAALTLMESVPVITSYNIAADKMIFEQAKSAHYTHSMELPDFVHVIFQHKDPAPEPPPVPASDPGPATGKIIRFPPR